MNVIHCQGQKYGNATIINEYCWLWLNRDGSPTRLTQRLYADLFPEADTPDKRYEVYAKELAKQTEFWRANGTCAGVLHFCGLGYSRTRDHWDSQVTISWMWKTSSLLPILKITPGSHSAR